MVKVKNTGAIVNNNPLNSTIDLPKETAERLVQKGLAEYVTEQRRTTRNTRTKAQPKAQQKAQPKTQTKTTTRKSTTSK